MDVEAALELAQRLIVAQIGKPLDDLPTNILLGSLQGKSLSKIAETYSCNESYAKEVSAKLCKLLSVALGTTITKRNLRSVLEQHLRLEKQNSEAGLIQGEGVIATSLIPNQNFIGRKNAIADLNTYINQGAKIIVIQAPGGVGKTTLAQEYLKSHGFSLVLELDMAKEKENIQLVDSVIEGWLKQDFAEEPGREFWEMLRRLKRQLQTRKIGILIDNLEPALDGQGKFIEPHRRYVELLRVLADATVFSVTLITSRFRLCEPDITVNHYLLPGLDESAWQEFFTSRNINIDIPTLSAIHKAYGGNAKAMGILCGAIQEDRGGDMVAYWQNNSGDLLVKADLENLVTSQFDRLQELNPEAYKLLCRLGCYRYQDVPTVPDEGLLCLLWDVPEIQRRRVIESLRNRSLVEFNQGEYWLHPMIREEAITRLRKSEDWETANIKSAEFWTASVESVETIKDGLTALEAYYHYIEIDDFNLAASIIAKEINNKWGKGQSLGGSISRFGLLQQTASLINKVKDKLENSYVKARLYQILGDIQWLRGSIHQAINYHKECKSIAEKIKNIYFDSEQSPEIGLNLYQLYRLSVLSLFNQGLCYLNMGDLKKSYLLFEETIFTLSNKEIILITKENQLYQYYFYHLELSSYLYLALINSYWGNTETTLSYINQSEPLKPRDHIWNQGYTFLCLGTAYKNINETLKSFQMYNQAISFAEETNFTQVKAKALTGLGELYRIQGEFTTALTHHQESIKILENIGAKCYLAEAYYQLALTYQKMGNFAQSQEFFQKAIQLFTEMEAPKQIEKVQQSILPS